MITLELTPAEADALEEVLATYESELRTEITHTDRRDLRTTLKERETVVKSLMERLAAVRRQEGGAGEPVPQI